MNKSFLATVLLVFFCFFGCGKKSVDPVNSNQSFAISTIAGNTFGYVDGIGVNASFTVMTSIATDQAGNIYVGDSPNIRKITPAGAVTTFAGNNNVGFADGPGTSASFSMNLNGMAVDKAGNVYVADVSRIRKITPQGIVSTFAGNGIAGHEDGTVANARFWHLMKMDFDAAGNLYVVDSGIIRKITPNGTVSTLNITIPSDLSNLAYGIVTFTIGADGNFYVIMLVDTYYSIVYKMTPSGTLTFLAGQQRLGYVNGAGKDARFSHPSSIITDISGNIYVYDSHNFRIRKITPSGEVSTFAGTGKDGNKDGPLLEAEFSESGFFASDNSGNIYIAQRNASCVRKISKQ